MLLMLISFHFCNVLNFNILGRDNCIVKYFNSVKNIPILSQ